MKRKSVPNSNFEPEFKKAKFAEESLREGEDSPIDADVEIEDDEPPEELDLENLTSEEFHPLRKGWQRPVAPPLDMDKDLVFQMVDADYFVAPRVEGYPGARLPKVPVVRIYGITKEGHSVLCNARGFVPYFYCKMPVGFDPRKAKNFKDVLNSRLSNSGMKKDDGMEFVVDVKVVEKTPLMHFQHHEKGTFLKISTGMPFYVPRLRTILETGIEIPGLGHRILLTFESNVLFILRCMIDKKLVGCSWVRLEGGKYKSSSPQISFSQYEVTVGTDHLHAISLEENSTIAPFRTLSFDIECAGRDGHFPDPTQDPVIQIANYVTLQGESQPIIKNVFVLGECSDIPGAEVHSFETEEALLLAWNNFVLSVDPDILTGYNIVGFDFVYLIQRAASLNLKQKFQILGRLKKQISVMKKKTLSSKQMGTREGYEVDIKGRVQLDVLLAVRLSEKLSSYSLNNVSSVILKEQKEDVHHSIISKLHHGSKDDRKRLAVYCLKDAYLPQRLLDKLMIVVNYVEMARVTGIPLSFILTHGQQIKVVSQLLRHAKERDLIMPVPPRNAPRETASFEGAEVLKPTTGYHQTPIATLDFASLYPSIMMAHNLCYTTLLKPNEVNKLDPSEYVRTPTGHCFVKKSKYSGLLPDILKSLLHARKIAKNDLKKATDPMEKAVLNGRQLALKVSANSVYGFTGATIGKLPCLAISSSVTAYGRDMIQQTRNYVEETYTISNGYKYDAKVIYGDTDSVMVKFGKDVKEAMEFGQKAADEITKALFVNPIKLEFEKVYFPYLLFSKKRYAGVLFTKPEKYDYLDMKGIQAVRRDHCQLVRHTVDTILRLLLIQKSKKKAVKFAKDIIKDLVTNKIDMSMLIMSRTLSKKFDAYKNKQPHVELAKKLNKRDLASAPHLGDRVPFVIVSKSKGAKMFEKAEDPIYALMNDIPIDTDYYKKALRTPVTDIFQHVLQDSEVNDIFEGAHTKTIIQIIPKNIGIAKFCKKVNHCLGCKTKCSEVLCKFCKPKEAEIYQKLLNERNHFETIYGRVWTNCQRCQQSLHNEVLCSNMDCELYYLRQKLKIDLDRSEKKLASLSLD